MRNAEYFSIPNSDESETKRKSCDIGYHPFQACDISISVVQSQQTWEKLFQNMRATRQTELADTFPDHVVSKWLGNSVAVAKKHFLRTTDEHFAKAIQCEVKKTDHNTAQNCTVHNRMGKIPYTKWGDMRLQKKAISSRIQFSATVFTRALNMNKVTRPGLEPGIAESKSAVLPITLSGN